MTEPTGLISGRFRLGELLGTGGSASVFAAVDTTNGASVALKLLHPHFSGRPETREAFFAEARRAEALRHPNIAGVLDVGVDTESAEPVAWIALELAPGSSLSEHVGRFGQLSVAEAIAVLDGVLRALEAAHAIGLVHRDVSPANVMVSRGASGSLTVDGVRLLDFGLADAAGRAAIGADVLRSEQAGGRAGVIGNVEYMSPEQVRGAAVDERGDVYQAGALLHFALTGRAPFTRSTPAETMRAHLETPPPVPSVMDSRIPRHVDRLVVKALLKDPVDRFASAAEMRTALATAATLAGAAAGDAGRSTRATQVVAPKRRPDAENVTRVLGSTRLPNPSPVVARTAVQRGGATPRPIAKRRPSKIGAWMSGAGLALIVAAIIGSVAASAPAVPVPTPSPTAEETASPAPLPADEPTPSSAPVWTPPAVADVVVPQLAFSTLADASRTLADAGLEVGELVVVDSERAGDTVLGSSPAAGERTAPGAVVSLTVASGFNRVPHVVGLSRADALAALQRAGFTVAIGTRPVAGVAAGTIVGTDPGEGASLALATTVTLLEAELPPRATPQPTVTPTPTPEPGV